MYNIVDDRPQSFADYVRELSAKPHRPGPIPISRRLVGMVASYPAIAFGDTWLPLSNAKAKAELGWSPVPRSDYSPVKLGVRFSNVAVMPSVRSFDGRNAEFQTAT